MHRYLDATRKFLHKRLTTWQFAVETGAFLKRHWVGWLALLAVVALFVWAGHQMAAHEKEDRAHNNPNSVYGHNPTALVNPNAALEGGGYAPTPSDIFAPPDSNAETYPGFPPGTRFLPGLVRDRLTVVSKGIAIRFWAKYGLHTHCAYGQHIHRYVDPEKQTLARSTVGGCNIFIDIHTKIPAYKVSWNAMGYCNLIVHEAGHNIGLLHSPNPSDIMYYTGNSRARTGCQKFAPESYGTVALTRVPSTIRCAGETATRYWLSGDYARAAEYAAKHPGNCP